ncbi:hypothetical protein TWF481_000091 [Arthrobotrys musiformis]|uniref:Nephrocystin 3-like N-terminal domain-containing protein n=1 Tax=Arthrobotrys musiformis TaxID=47236 RepID=A0AAV9WLK5_9PEZI
MSDRQGDLTVGTSVCWKLGRERFERKIPEEESLPEDQQSDRLRKFFKKYPLYQAFNSCNEIKNLAAEKYGGEERQNKIGTLLETLDTFKDVVDGLLSCAPESISAVWLGLGMIIKIVSDDLVTCKVIVDAFDSIITITQFSLLAEKRYLHNISHDDQTLKTESMEHAAFGKIQDLICAIFDFSWHAQYHLSPRWDKEISKSNSDSQRFGDKVKDSMAKTGHKIKKAAQTIGSKFREAIIGDIKAKHEEIQGLYTEIQGLCLTLFQEATASHNQDVLDKLNRALRETEVQVSQGVYKIQDSIKESRELLLAAMETNTEKITDEIKEGNETVVAAVEATIQNSTDIIVENITAVLGPQKDILDAYLEIFQGSSASENFFVGLKNRKVVDSALTANSWVLNNKTYQSWRDPGILEQRRVLYLNARKGHGKTMTMLSAYEDLLGYHASCETALVLRFFFKLGDTELQSGLTALESLFLQLISRVKEGSPGDSTRKNLNEILCNRIGVEIDDYKRMSSKEKCKIIQGSFRAVSSAFNIRAYVVLDAIDECQDRAEVRLLDHLERLVSSADSQIRVLVSVREEIDIKEELARSGVPEFEILAVATEDTAKEMEDFLKGKLAGIIKTRIKDQENTASIAAEMERYLPSIRRKVQGDFAYANMVVATLREPSKVSLKARIINLPSSVEEIYRQSLQRMKASERHLIIFALRWIAWSFSDVTALQIAEHYRGVYRDPYEDEEAYEVDDYLNIAQDPEIRETINHLQTVGRDFFTFVGDTEPITVHLTVREWVKKPLNLEKVIPNTELQAKVLNSIGGNFVFEVQIPANGVPAGHHELSELFNAEESHIAIASDCLRALLNPKFQQCYEPWSPPQYERDKWQKSFETFGVPLLVNIDPHKVPPSSELKPRYEVLAVMKHLDVLKQFYSQQKFWSDPKWMTLRRLFDEFTNQRRNFSWYLWHSWYLASERGSLQHARQYSSYLIKKPLGNETYEFYDQLYQHAMSPLEFLIKEYPYLIEVYCYIDAPLPRDLIPPHRIFLHDDQGPLVLRGLRLRFAHDTFGLVGTSHAFDPTKIGPAGLYAATWCYKSIMEEIDIPEDEMTRGLEFFIRKNPKLLVPAAIWMVFLTTYACGLEYLSFVRRKKFGSFWTTLGEAGNETSTFFKIKPERILQTPDRGLPVLYKEFMAKPTIVNILNIIRLEANNCQPTGSRNRDGLDATFANVIQFCLERARYRTGHIDFVFLTLLLRLGAQPNAESHLEDLFIIVFKELDQGLESSPIVKGSEFLEFFELLLNKGYGILDALRQAMFGAARIRWLDLLKILIEAQPTLVDQVDQSGRSIMHLLFINDALDSFKAVDLIPFFEEIYKVRPGLVNAQDNKSRAPLSYAVEACYLEGVQVLLKHGADIHDDDELGHTALHNLCSRQAYGPSWCGSDDCTYFEQDVLILSALESASINMDSRTKTLATPLAIALQYQSFTFISIFLQHLRESRCSGESYSSTLLYCDIDNRNILHYAMAREELTCPSARDGFSKVVTTVFSSLSKEQRQYLLNSRDLSQGFTPLHEAAKRGYTFLAQLFLWYDADPNVECLEGYTAMHYLIKDGFEKDLPGVCPHFSPLIFSRTLPGEEPGDTKTDDDFMVSLFGDTVATSGSSTALATLRSVAIERG